MGNISKRFLSLLVAVVMVVAMIPASVFAVYTDRGVAAEVLHVGCDHSMADSGQPTTYSSFGLALEDVHDGETIKLAADIELTESLTITKDVTLDLSEHTFYMSGSTTPWIYFTGDVTVVGGVTVPMKAINGGKLTIDGGDNVFAMAVEKDSESTLSFVSGKFLDSNAELYTAEGSTCVFDEVNQHYVVTKGSSTPEVTDPEGYKVVSTEADLAAALTAGGKVKLGADINVATAIEIPAGVTVELDLADHDIVGGLNGSSTTKHIYVITNRGTFTVKDSVGEGKITSRGVYNYGTMTLESGTIDACDGDGGYAVNNEPGSTFTMNGGVLSTSYEDDYQSDKGGYDATALDVPAGCTATLNGGKITNVCDFTFAIAAAGTLNIPATSTVVVEGNHGAIAVSGGITTIDAGTFKVIKDTYLRTDNVTYVSGGQLIINGGTFVGDSDTAASGSCVCDVAGGATINGGNFSGSSGGDVWGATGTTINGGTFENLTETQHVTVGATIVNKGETLVKTENGLEEVKPMGTLTNCYTSGTGYWGECGGNASESFVFKFYNGDTYMGSTSLNNVGGIIDGDVYVSWSILLDAESNTDPYWTMEWTIQPTINMQPTRCEQWVDGVKVAEATVEPNWSDKIFPVVAAVTDENGEILSFVNGTTGYTLADAVAKGGTVVLLRDVTLTDTLTVPAGVTVTLDLNGKTISQEKACTASYEMIANNGTLTITGNGKISFKDTGAGDPNAGWGSYTIRNSGTLVVENGTIEHLGEQNQAGQAFAHTTLAIFQYSGSTTINGGTISTPNYRSVRLWSGNMTINGGTFDGQVWVHCVNDTSKLTINGGEFSPNGNDGSSVFVNNSGYKAELSVTDGYFATRIGADDPAALNGPITGGTFSEAAVNGTNAALLGNSFEFKANGDGTYGVKLANYVAEIDGVKYESLQAAIDAAYAAGGEVTITLMGNITENVTITEKVGLYLTIDGADKIMVGTVIINPLSDTNDNRRTTIQNVNFANDGDAGVDFISAVKTNHYPRLSVLACTFTGNGQGEDVAIRTKSAYDLIIKDCEGTKLHSFLQNTAGVKVTIKNTKITDSKGGLAMGTAQNVEIRGCEIETDTYGIRLDAVLDTSVTLNGNVVTAYIPVSVRKATAAEYKLSFAGSASSYTATNADGVWCAICATEYEAGVALNPATGNVKVTLNTDDLDESGIYGAYEWPVIVVFSDGYTKGFDSLKSAMNFGYSGGTKVKIIVNEDITEAMDILEGNIVTENPDGVTIKNTIVDEWIYCSDDFTIGEGVTYDATGYASGLFVYADNAVINGTVLTDCYYQRYAGTKLTINEPGSMTVKTETFILRYTDGDGDAGIYINGDNDDTTVGLNAAVIYFYQGCINAKDADIKVGTYWQTNETDGTGSASLILDNTNMTVTVNEHNMKATGNSTVTLSNGSSVAVAGGYQGVAVAMDESSSFTKNGNAVLVAKVGNVYYTTLQAAVNAVADGGTITLVANETFNNSNRTNSGGSWYEGLYYEGDKSFTIDLGGFTVTNTSAINDYLMLFKNAGSKANVITIKNGTLEATSSAYCALCTSSTSTQQITVNLEDVTLIGNNSNGSVVKVRGGTVLNVKAGTVITGKDSYLGIECIASVANIEDGAEIYMNGTTSYNGCLVGVGSNGTVNVYGGYGKGASGGFIAMTSGGTINIHGGEWIANTDGTIANDNKGVLVAQSDKNYNPGAGNSVINVTGGTFKGGYNCYGNAVGDAQIVLSGGTYNADPDNGSITLADKYEVVDNGDGTYTVKQLSFVKDEATKTATIYNLEGLYAFAEAVNGGNKFQGWTIKLNADVDLAAVTTFSTELTSNWEPLANFNGTFDGQGHKISNLIIVKPGVSNVGFFGTTQNGEIKNVVFENAIVTGRLNVGVVAGQPYTSKYTNIKVTGHIEVNGMAYVGGVGGKNAYANWTDVTVDVDPTSYVKATSTEYDPNSSYADENGYVSYRTYVGGVVGFIGEGGHTFKNISSNVKVIGDVCDIGGLFGIAHYGNNFDGVTFTGSVEAPAGAEEVGGIAGVWHNQKGQTVTFTNVTSTGTVTVGTETTTGSIVGGAYNAENETSDNSGSLIVDGNEVWLCVAKIGDVKYATLAEAIAAAQPGDEVKILKAGTYAVPTGKSITVTGAVDGVVFNGGQNNIGMNGASVTFNNVTFNWAANGWPYHGLAHCGDMVYNNCTFNGTVFLYGTSETFNNCTFNVTGDTYNVWTYSAKDVVFNGCTFNSDGKSVLIYHEGASVVNNVTVTDCDFIASAPVAGKAAIEMDSSLTGGIKLTIDAATTATGFGTGNVSGNSLWNNKKGSNTDANNDITVIVNGETVLAPTKFAAKIGEVGYATIAEAIAAAQPGETVTILAGEYNESLNINKAITVVGETDGNGNNLVKLNGGITISGNNAAVKYLTASNPATTGYDCTLSISAANVLVEGCVITDTHVMRYSTAKGDVTFKDCVLTATSTWAIHFDSGSGAVVVDGCEVNGWIAFSGGLEKVTLKDSTFDAGNWAGGRTYNQSLEISGCTFEAGYKLDLASENTQVTVTNSQMSDGSSVVGLFNSADACGQNNIVIDGDELHYVAAIGSTYYETLAEALANVGDWTTIKLVDDAVLDYNARDAFGKATTTDIIIDGQGFTLTLNQKNSDWASIGMANSQGKLTLKNMTIEKTGYGDTSGAWNTHAIIFSCNVEMTDVTVNNSVAVQNGATLNNVTINEANGYYGLWINGNGQTVTVNGGAINATNGGRGIKIADQYIDAPASVNLTIDGTVFNTAKKAAVLVSSTAGANITASNCDITNVAEDSVNLVWVDEDWATSYGEVTVTGATKSQESVEDFVISVIDDAGNVIAYYKDLGKLFADYEDSTDTVNVLLTGDVETSELIYASSSTQVDFNFTTNVASGVTITLSNTSGWNYVPHMTIGKNVTLNVPYRMCVYGKVLDIYGTVKTGYLYNLSGSVTVKAGGHLDVTSGEKTIQVKNNGWFEVYGTAVAGTVNVWNSNTRASQLIVSGANASLTAEHIHAWDGGSATKANTITVENGATLTATNLQADRGSEVSVDNAKLVADTITLGYDTNIGKLALTNGAELTVSEKMNIAANGEFTMDATAKSNLVASVVDASGAETCYTSLAEAIAAAQDGDTVKLLTDVALTAPITVKKSITIDGNGKTITANISDIALLYFEGANGADLNVTVKNATFDGLKTGAAIRTLYADITIDNCVFQNGNHTAGQGLVRLTYGTAKITNSKFLNNNCVMGISFNWDGNGNADDTLTVDNCEFTGNTANKTALIYYVKGVGCEIKNSEFVSNTVNAANNSAVIYLGFQENCTVTGNLFKNNTVKDTSTSTRVAGAIFAGYQATITGNAFEGNTASNANGDVLGQVCISTYYADGNINLNGNYWNGTAPVLGKDITIQHQTGAGVYGLETYYAAYSLDANGNVVLADEQANTFVAQIAGSTVKYTSINAALEAAQAGDTVIILADVALNEYVYIAAGKTVALDLNGKTVSMEDASAATSALLKNYGDLTIKDSVGGGKLTFHSTTPSANNGYASNTISNYGKLTIESGVIENTTVGGACYALDNYAGSTATINGGELIAEKTAVRIFSWTNGTKSVLNVNGGSILSKDGYGINFNLGNAPAVELNITGGTITTNDTDYNLAVYLINKGSAENMTVNVTGGTFNGYFALNGVSATTMAENAVSISGGTFTGVICYADPAFGFVSGGTFSSAVAEEYCADGYIPVDNGNGTYGVKVGAYTVRNTTTGVGYETLAEAIAAAQAGDTIKLLAHVTEDVTVNKSITIDGDGKNYTGNIAVTGSTVAATIKNVNFVNGTGYAVTTNRIKSITIENCTVTNYVWGFLYANKTSPVINVKNVTVDGGSYGMHWVYGTSATLENVVMKNVTYGIMIQNYASKTVTLKNCSIEATTVAIHVWERDGYSGVQTFKFVGMNEISALPTSTYAKVVAEAQIVAANSVKLGDLQSVFHAAENGETVTVLTDCTLTWDGKTEIEGIPCLLLVKDKSITLDLNGKAVTADMTGMNAKYNIGIVVAGTGELTVNATNGGSITASGVKAYSLFSAYNETTKLTINGGTFELAEALDCLIHSAGDEIVIINGGTFTLGNVGAGTNGQPWIFNANGANYRKVIVNGGTFDADVNHQFWANEVYVPENLALKNNGDGTWTVVPAVAYVVERPVSTNGYDRKVGYATLEEAVAAALNGKTVTLLQDVALDTTINIANGDSITLDLNGHTIAGTDNATGSFGLITNRGDLTIKDSVGTGKITLVATNDRGWNAYSSVISNTVGGKLTVTGGTIEHLGGTSMAYGIDNLTNGKGTYAETVIEGGHIKSTYRAIRMFLNGVEAQNILTVNGGTIEGANKSIWMQDPSKNPNTGKLTVSENANLIGDVYLYVTPGSTEWPVEIAIAKAALNSGSTVLTGNIPTGIDVKVVNGIYTIVKVVAAIGEQTYTTLAEALSAAQSGSTITLLWKEGDAPIAMNGAVFGKTVTITGTATVDWSKGFLFIGRGGVGNGTVIFDNANLTSASNSASYGIHVSGREKDTTNKYDGTLIINNSNIELDYLINKGTITMDASTLTVKNGFSVGGRPASETESGEDATATLTLNNGSKLVVNNHNGMGLGYEAIGVMNVNSGSTFECTKDFLVTAKGTMNVNGGTVAVAGKLTTNGVLNVGEGSNLTAAAIVGSGKIVVDANGMSAGPVSTITADASGFTGTLEAINNGTKEIKIEDGKIVLVAKEVEKFELYGANVTLGNNLDMKFAFAIDKVSDWTGHYVKIVKENADGTTREQTYYYDEGQWQKDGNYYVVVFTGIAAKEMSDELTVTVYNAAGEAVSEPWVDSMRAYAMRQLNSDKNAENALLKTAIVDMLNYGAAAQKYFDYDEGNLANALLTDAQKKYATESTELTLNGYAKPQEYYYGSNLTLKSNIVFQIGFTGLTDDMTVEVAYTNHSGDVVTASYQVKDLTLNAGIRVVVLDKLVVSDARQVITITVKDASGTEVFTMQESIEEYMARRDKTDIEESFMKFSDSAHAYLHRNDK